MKTVLPILLAGRVKENSWFDLALIERDELGSWTNLSLGTENFDIHICAISTGKRSGEGSRWENELAGSNTEQPCKAKTYISVNRGQVEFDQPLRSK